MLVNTSTIPVSSLKSTRATSTPLSVITIVPLVIGWPVTGSVTVTRTLVLPATVVAGSAVTLLSRFCTVTCCVPQSFSGYVSSDKYVILISWGFSPFIGISSTTLASPSITSTVTLSPFGKVTLTLPVIASPVSSSLAVILSVTFPCVSLVNSAVITASRALISTSNSILVALYFSSPLNVTLTVFVPTFMSTGRPAIPSTTLTATASPPFTET